MNYWSWKGKYIGSRSGKYLFSKKGEPLGYFVGDELYNFEGKYIGEIMNTDRIIVCITKKNKSNSSCMKPCNHVGMSYCNYVGYAMLAGYEDFKLEEE
jgi:hypothetical protein